MKLPPFSWSTASCVDDCVAALGGGGDDEEVKIVAGGQSLLPLMALGLAAPAHLVDIGHLDRLDAIERTCTCISVGATVRHSRLLEPSGDLAFVPLLALAASHIGHLAVRNRGTIGGSLAHADPAAELPALAVLLDACLVCQSQARGRRELGAAEFFAGPYTTSLEDDEMLTWVNIPVPSPRTSYGFTEFAPRAGDFARAGAGCVMRHDEDGTLAGLRAVTFATSPTPREVTTNADLPIGEPVNSIAWETLAHRLVSGGTGPVQQLAAVALHRAFLQAAAATQAYADHDGDPHLCREH
jgi:carbon-monoxide dehydrogenase medium subunit